MQTCIVAPQILFRGSPHSLLTSLLADPFHISTRWGRKHLLNSSFLLYFRKSCRVWLEVCFLFQVMPVRLSRHTTYFCYVTKASCRNGSKFHLRWPRAQHLSPLSSACLEQGRSHCFCSPFKQWFLKCPLQALERDLWVSVWTAEGALSRVLVITGYWKQSQSCSWCSWWREGARRTPESHVVKSTFYSIFLT